MTEIKVVKLALPKNYIDQVRTRRKCCRLNKSQGSFRRDSNRCQRAARYDIDGLGYCTQHAGEAALNHLLT